MEKVIYENGQAEIRDDYTKIFYTNLSLRPSCGNCRFADIHRISDFTIGDFWGVQNIYPEFADEKGVSILFLNTERADAVFQNIMDKLEIQITDIAQAMQPNLREATKVSKLRRAFWKDFEKHGVMYCARKWPRIIEFPIILKAKIRKLLKG